MLLLCALTPSCVFAGSPFEIELQKLEADHQAGLKDLLRRATEAEDAKAASQVTTALAVSVKKPTLEQTISGTRWSWFNSVDFTNDKHWIEFNADGARIGCGWPLKWAIEGPATVLVRRTDTDDYFMHFNMDMAKLEGVADPRISRSHDPRSIRFERRLK